MIILININSFLLKVYDENLCTSCLFGIVGLKRRFLRLLNPLFSYGVPVVENGR
jgi:hypothetical protein